MKKRFISASIAAALAFSAFAGTGALPAAAESDYGLPAKTTDGVMLHAFDWSYNTIKENLPDIAAAGYTAVQTSPVQQPKDFGNSKDTSGQWWKLYQPLSFSVAEKSWLGTKDELTALCTEADKYGIKIICDIVSNHMANKDDQFYNTYCEDIKTYEPEIYANTDKYFHQLERDPLDSKLQYIVQGSLSKLPDLKTGDEFVQSRVISLLDECIDCGVDGFRFDAAKHIETPADGDYASDFWPNVIGAATQYAESKGTDLFCYGEVLNTPGENRKTTDYTKYLHLTDNKAGDATLVCVMAKKPEKVAQAQGYSYSYDDPSNFVLWAESHDTYMGDSGSAGLKNTASASNEDIAKAWAIIAARAKSQSLFFARPDTLMGNAGDPSWKSSVVCEINKFHNKYVGTDDAVLNNETTVAVQRGDSGIVIVNLGESSDISLATNAMKDGTYTDAVTGAQFTVANGTITGKVGDTGIAVVYEGAVATPRVIFSSENTSFKTDTFKVTLTLENAESGTYQIDGGNTVSFTGTKDVVIGEGVDPGKEITVKATATQGTNTTETTHVYTKAVVDHSGVFVYFDNSKKNFAQPNVYAFYEEKKDDGTKELIAQNGGWPGVPMDKDEKTGLWVYEVPSDIPVGKGYVIILDGTNSDLKTKDLALKTNVSIFSDDKNRLVEFDPETYDPTKPTEPDKPEGEKLIYGDLNNDKVIASDDALDLLRYITGITTTLTDAQMAQADVDGDKEIIANDSLLILRYSVGFKDEGCLCGTEFTFGGKTPDNPTPAPGGDVFYVVNSAGWVFDDGCKIWIVNDDTNEAIETTKQDPENDSSEYSYAELPSNWKSITLYRTDWSASDVSGAYNTWKCGAIPEGKNAFRISSSETKTKFISFTPDA